MPNEYKNNYYPREKENGSPTLKLLAQARPPNPIALSASWVMPSLYYLSVETGGSDFNPHIDTFFLRIYSECTSRFLEVLSEDLHRYPAYYGYKNQTCQF